MNFSFFQRSELRTANARKPFFSPGDPLKDVFKKNYWHQELGLVTLHSHIRVFTPSAQFPRGQGQKKRFFSPGGDPLNNVFTKICQHQELGLVTFDWDLRLFAPSAQFPRAEGPKIVFSLGGDPFKGRFYKILLARTTLPPTPNPSPYNKRLSISIGFLGYLVM